MPYELALEHGGVDDNRTAFSRGLRQVADWLDEHPEVELPYLGRYVPGCDLPSLPIYLCGPDARTQLAAIARAMGQTSKGQIEDELIIWREFAGVVVFAQAASGEVCERLPTRIPRCPWCREAVGWCTETGGPWPCEWRDEAAAARAEAERAPVVRIGGTR